MKRIISITIVALTLSGTAAFAEGAKAIYERDCAKCHGVDGKGDTKMGHRTGARDYTDPKVQDSVTDEAAFKAIKDGLKDKNEKTLMGPTDGVSDDDIKRLVAYLRTFKK
jgi:cytochrome c553